jgi:citrate lyase beta subunit
MSEQPYQPRRSLIFAPGNQPEMIPKALKTGSDIVCVDLEDAIAPQHKAEAREKTLGFFATPQAADGVERIVRINCLRTEGGLRDVLAIMASDMPPPALMLTKVKSAEEVRLLDDLLAGRHAGVRFHVIIETNDGLEDCYAIAQACARIDSLLFGGVDMAADLRVEPTWEALLYARRRVVHAAAGAGVDAIDVPFLDLKDMDGLTVAAAASAEIGFTGKASIHPKQIPVINAAFSPTEAQLDRAQRIVDAFAQQDSGLLVVDGELIEKPVLRSMQRLLAIAERTGRAG